MPAISQAQWQALPQSHGLKHDLCTRMGKNRNKRLWGCVKWVKQQSGEEWESLGHSLDYWVSNLIIYYSPQTVTNMFYACLTFQAHYQLGNWEYLPCPTYMTPPMEFSVLSSICCFLYHSWATPARVCLIHFWCLKPPNSGSLLVQVDDQNFLYQRRWCSYATFPSIFPRHLKESLLSFHDLL